MIWRDFLRRTSDLLNDQDPDDPYRRWSESLLADFASQGIYTTLWLRPDKFGAQRIITLAAGSEQTLPDDCLFFRKGSNNVDASGRVTTPIFEVAYDDQRRFFDTGCVPCRRNQRTYRASEIAYNPNDRRQIAVKPPVPEGQSANIQVICCTPPDPRDCTKEMPRAWEEFSAGLMAYVAMRALMQDTESVSSQRIANTHRSDYASMLNVSMKSVEDAMAKPPMPGMR